MDDFMVLKYGFMVLKSGETEIEVKHTTVANRPFVMMSIDGEVFLFDSSEANRLAALLTGNPFQDPL